MSREQVEALATGLRSARERGELAEQDFKRLHGALVARDEQGIVWTVGLREGRWHRLEGQSWVSGSPPDRLYMAEAVAAELGKLRPASATGQRGTSDDAILDWLVDDFVSNNGVNPRGDVTAMKRLRDAISRAREQLETASQTEIDLPFFTADASGPKHFKATLTRAQLKELAP